LKKIIITFAIIFISTSSVFSQSLNSISKTDSLKTKDTIINATKTSVKSINQDSYFTFSSGLMHYDDNKNIFYTSLDLNINTVYIFYIDLGLYGLLNKSGGGVALHGTAGIGLDIVRDKLFASAGAGYFYQVPFYLANIVSLRVNYKFSKSFSAGLDNKFIFNWKLNYHRNIYSIGLNVSYDLDN
jgi:hypothetical protein